MIAKACGVSDHFFGVLRKPISNPIGDSPAPPTRTVTRNGTTYEPNTANIGKAQPVIPVATASRRSKIRPQRLRLWPSRCKPKRAMWPLCTPKSPP